MLHFIFLIFNKRIICDTFALHFLKIFFWHLHFLVREKYPIIYWKLEEKKRWNFQFRWSHYGNFHNCWVYFKSNILRKFYKVRYRYFRVDGDYNFVSCKKFNEVYYINHINLTPWLLKLTQRQIQFISISKSIN